MHSDFEHDPDEPMMEGSDDKLSDLEMSDSDNASSSCTQPQQPNPSNNNPYPQG